MCYHTIPNIWKVDRNQTFPLEETRGTRSKNIMQTKVEQDGEREKQMKKLEVQKRKHKEMASNLLHSSYKYFKLSQVILWLFFL